LEPEPAAPSGSLKTSRDHPEAIDLLLSQHSLLHASEVSGINSPTFEEEIWTDLSDSSAREIPARCDHSIAWMFWHIARIEDITMNILVAGGSQILHQGGWYDRLCVIAQDTGNAMDLTAIIELSTRIDLTALRQYRSAVGLSTRQIVQQLTSSELERWSIQ